MNAIRSQYNQIQVQMKHAESAYTQGLRVDKPYDYSSSSNVRGEVLGMGASGNKR